MPKKGNDQLHEDVQPVAVTHHKRESDAVSQLGCRRVLDTQTETAEPKQIYPVSNPLFNILLHLGHDFIDLCESSDTDHVITFFLFVHQIKSYCCYLHQLHNDAFMKLHQEIKDNYKKK